MNTLWNRFIIGFKQDGFAWLETIVVSVLSIYVWTSQTLWLQHRLSIISSGLYLVRSLSH